MQAWEISAFDESPWKVLHENRTGQTSILLKGFDFADFRFRFQAQPSLKIAFMAEEGTFAKVAIIGAGWAGLQLLQTLKEHGIQAELFEGLESVGGTWSPHMSYHALSTHSPLNVNTMTAHGKPFPFENMPKRYLEKADAKEMHEYLNGFVDKMDLRKFIHCSTRVVEIHYDTRPGNS